MTVDRIQLRRLRVLARCGAGAEERSTPQPLEIDLDVVADLAPAGRSDRLDDTVDYGAVCQAVVESAAAPAALLEHLAERLAAAVLDGDQRVEAVTVAVRKLRPPVPHDLASAGVRVHRAR
ncbi:MAG TPA: dihydroneopterin aldolase [Acidimicrobiales bacterium]|nr:dihydroneopterin aldolase [Acidimicrobiales bacterium]